jgi:glutamyl-tRNA reductase
MTQNDTCHEWKPRFFEPLPKIKPGRKATHRRKSVTGNSDHTRTMGYSTHTASEFFFVAGINYKKTDAETRGLFAITNEQYESIINLSQFYGVSGLFVLSTCNRTEIYGMAKQGQSLIDLLSTQTKGNPEILYKTVYLKTGSDALEHLFKVGAGLDSQILGDYEIVGQLKQAVKFSKERNGMDCFLERLTNSVFQSSKEIKNETGLSSGTVSVSFAAVQYLKQNLPDCIHKNILLIGTGKIGSSTCKNLVDYLGATNITLINRSKEKAAQLAGELNLKYAPVEDIEVQLASSDVILVATNANEPTILKSHLENKGTKVIIDLSVPYSVEQSVSLLENVRIVNIDEISKIKDQTIKTREAEIPKAEKIIQKHIGMFTEWQLMRQNAPALKAIKSMLNEIVLLHREEFLNPQTRCPYIAAEQKIQQIVNKMAGKMRGESKSGCYYLQAISELMLSTSS